MKPIKEMTREELADELGAACVYTEDWETAEIGDLRDRLAAIPMYDDAGYPCRRV